MVNGLQNGKSLPTMLRSPSKQLPRSKIKKLLDQIRLSRYWPIKLSVVRLALDELISSLQPDELLVHSPSHSFNIPRCPGPQHSTGGDGARRKEEDGPLLPLCSQNCPASVTLGRGGENLIGC